MITRQKLLSDLQTLLKRLEADLLERSESTEIPDVGQTLRAEYERAKKAERTAQNYEDWRGDTITQAAAAWVLSCVFVRFLEDNKLIDPPKIAGPRERLQQARDEHTLYFQDSERAKLTDREYLLSVFDELAKLPGTKDVFGEHNPIRELPNWVSGDAAGELLRFFQKIEANTGNLIHDFTDPDWDTRFLGDLYQDLSEAARKKYALLQTPEFVEEFILDRTLDPALEEYGLDAPPVTDRDEKAITEAGFRMIDPACGSGHFLLGAFPRILDRWQKQEPGGKIRDLVQQTLDCIHGVDVNPYAVAIARFRLLLMAMKACGICRLADAPGFHFNLVCGDSLLHAPLRGGQQVFDWELSNEDVECEHAYQSEDLDELKRMLRSGIYHAVVANPPYIVPNDATLNGRYRLRFQTCYRAYSLAVPFMERICQLGVIGGFSGQITANSFMTREFGKRLVESFLPTVDINTIIDTSGAYLPGHGTPTLILFARRRSPVSDTIRAVLGNASEPVAPEIPSEGIVWRAIVKQIDTPGSESELVSVAELPRKSFAGHPWSLRGGGALALLELLENSAKWELSELIQEIGFGAVTREDDVYLLSIGPLRRHRISSAFARPLVEGDSIRDWMIYEPTLSLWPYSENDLTPDSTDTILRFLWAWRTQLKERVAFGMTQSVRGLEWFEYSMFFRVRYRGAIRIAFAKTATHNHFAVANKECVFKDSSPVMVLNEEPDRPSHWQLLGALNSSSICFWMKQIFPKKGGGGIGRGLTPQLYEKRYDYDTTKIQRCPIPDNVPLDVAKELSSIAIALSRRCVGKIHGSKEITRDTIDSAAQQWNRLLSRAVALQEEIDWAVYDSVGLLEDSVTSPDVVPDVRLGERAFEIVLARKIQVGQLETSWFDRHNASPISDIPTRWPAAYRNIVERRIKLIETDARIGLLEQPEYKRRWTVEPWNSQVDLAIREWILNRLESYFDFDGRMSDDEQPSSRLDITLTTVAKLADVARQDAQFMEVGEVYRDDAAFDVQRLVEELVQAENVPLLPVLRYKTPGLRKRKEWEKTWELQRREDAIDGRTQFPKDDPQYLTEDQARDFKQREVGDIPVPPKYKSSDFISTGGARYWALRGKLDVPKERWVSFPHCEGPDGTLTIAWAGYDHLQLAQAISAYFVDIQERLGGRDDPRLVPLLACIIELLPWLKQWHAGIDPNYNQRMDEVFAGFVTEEAKNLGMTIEEIKGWQPPKKTRSRKRRGAGT